MELDEWCAAAHVDIGMRTGLEATEDALRDWTAGGSELPGVLDLLALKDERRPNHFEVVGRFRVRGFVPCPPDRGLESRVPPGGRPRSRLPV